MTLDYSIELQAENIYNNKVKEYFKEVLSSYIQGNYRSALVILWTITITDLIYKLQELSEIYEDNNAKEILEKIKKTQKENPKNPKWENELIKLIEEKKYFETYIITHLKNLQDNRNLAAHPIIKEDTLELYQPNKETVRAFIRNILEYILTKPALLKKDIFSKLLDDLSDKKDLFPNNEELEIYLRKKYLDRMPKEIQKYIFKHLWKMVFSVNNEKAKENRLINFKTLSILYFSNKRFLLNFLRNDCRYFSEKMSANLPKEDFLGYIVAFLFDFPEIIDCIEQNIKTLIINAIKRKEKFYGISYFIFNNPKEYIDFVKEKIIIENNDEYFNVPENYSTFSEKLVSFSLNNDIINELIEIYFYLFSKSYSYNEADKKFDNLIKPILKYLKKKQLINLIEIINKNNQIYNRGKAREDHKLIKEKCENLCKNEFDWSKYPKFIQSLEDY
jgi:hypothetical protein